MLILVATDREVVVFDVERGASAPGEGIGGRPTCLTTDPVLHGRAWCGTQRDGVFRSDDGGRSWQSVGLAGRLIMAVSASRADRDVVWVGTEPSEVWRSGDAGNTWEQTSKLEALSSSSQWSFPPRPDTHHVRWIACHPLEPERLWVAIEAGALVSTIDGGRSWSDRVPGGPWDTHELAIHQKSPDTLRVAAGDGYFESHDAGATWRSPSVGLEVGYLRSVGDRSRAAGGHCGIGLVRPVLRVRGWTVGWSVVSPSHWRTLGACSRRLARTRQHNRASALRRRERRRALGRG